MPVCAVGATAPCSTTYSNELAGATSVSAGYGGFAAILSNGTVAAWGVNDSSLGDGAAAPTNVPVLVCSPAATGPCPSGPYLSGVSAVSISYEGSLALLAGGTLLG
jgi:hypothetical protein